MTPSSVRASVPARSFPQRPRLRHAPCGSAYSGTVAAAVYRSLEQQKPERIVVLAFPHRGGLEGLAIPDVETISTPLGEVPSTVSLPRGSRGSRKARSATTLSRFSCLFCKGAVPGHAE